MISKFVNRTDTVGKSKIGTPSRTERSWCITVSLGAAPFTVQSTPDFENTNGMEQNTIT